MNDLPIFPNYPPANPTQPQPNIRPKLLKPETIHKPLFSLARQMMKMGKRQNTRLQKRKRVKVI